MTDDGRKMLITENELLSASINQDTGELTFTRDNGDVVSVGLVGFKDAATARDEAVAARDEVVAVSESFVTASVGEYGLVTLYQNGVAL